jgi:glucose/mannose-6-phosphate isomerase
MIDLDERAQYGDIDQAGMLQRILELPEQIRDAWALAQSTTIPKSHAGASSIVICGMGGSAIGGDLTRSLVEAEARVPVVISRSYDLPRFVGSESLVIVSSFSGGTEETLSCCERALEANARVLAVTTGGMLAARAQRANFPLITFGYPDGQPREAIAYSTLLMLGVLSKLGYVADRTTEVEAAAGLLDEMAQDLGPAKPADENPAKRLAQRLFNRLGIIYGGGLMAEVARRWKGQLNENAKNWAFFEQLPELNHNAVLGYQFPSNLSERIMVVMLSSSLNHPRITFRESITEEVLGRWGVRTERVEARGTRPLEQVLSATYFGDFVSYYLALINDVDPSDIDVINYLKERLAQSQERRVEPFVGPIHGRGDGPDADGHVQTVR